MEVSQIKSGYNHQAQRFLLDASSSFRAANFNCHHPACARLYRVGQDRPGELFSRVAENSNTNLNRLSWAINMVCVCLAPSLRSLLLVCSEDSLLNSLRCSLPVVGFDSDSSSSSCRRSLFYYWHFHVAATGDRRRLPLAAMQSCASFCLAEKRGVFTGEPCNFHDVENRI